MTIQEICDKLSRNDFNISFHAFEEAVDDYFSLDEVIDAKLQTGEIIEHRPDDCRCLIYCKSKDLHIHVSIDYYDLSFGISQEIDIVTIYKPDPAFWINYRRRRK